MTQALSFACRFEDKVADSVRPVDVVDGKPAGFTGGLYGQVSEPEKALEERLIDLDVLHFGEFHSAARSGKHPGLVTELLARERKFGEAKLQIQPEGPDEKQDGWNDEPLHALRSIVVIAVRQSDKHERKRVNGLQELRAGPYDDGVIRRFRWCLSQRLSVQQKATAPSERNADQHLCLIAAAGDCVDQTLRKVAAVPARVPHFRRDTHGAGLDAESAPGDKTYRVRCHARGQQIRWNLTEVVQVPHGDPRAQHRRNGAVTCRELQHHRKFPGIRMSADER